MRMQVILDSSFARPGSAPIWGGKKVEFRDWTSFFYIWQSRKYKLLAVWRKFPFQTQAKTFIVKRKFL